MAFRPIEGCRYDMPAMFGPSPVPDRTRIADAGALVLSFSTTQDAAATLVPDYFTVPAQPTISVAHMRYRGVDYLGGRSYNELVVTVSATHGSGPDAIDAAFAPILWVDQVGALIAGREYMGLPKLIGTIPDAEGDDAALRFRCAEYDSGLIEGEARNLTPLPAQALETLNRRAGEVRTFGWKYIPAAGGGSDVDHPLVNVMRWTYRRAWSGSGDLRFLTPDRIAAPFSAAALAFLARIPVTSAIRAFRGEGEALIDRTATRRLSASS